MRLILRLLLLIILSVLSANLPADELEEDHSVSYGDYFLSLRRNQGRSIATNHSYTTVELMAFPGSYRDFWPFLDLRAHYFDKFRRYSAKNIGVGVRFAPDGSDRVYGMNAYYDWYKARHGSFNQFGLGFEVLSCFWNFRLNGYLPFGKRSHLERSSISWEGPYFTRKNTYNESLAGVDFEIEAWLTRICCTDIFLGIGPYYYYSGSRCSKNIYGVEYRLSSQLGRCAALDIIMSNDCHFKTRVMAQLTWTFGCGCREEYDYPIFAPVRRQELIVHRTRPWWTWNY